MLAGNGKKIDGSLSNPDYSDGTLFNDKSDDGTISPVRNSIIIINI